MMGKFKAGDLVVVKKPTNTEEYPYWDCDAMDQYDRRLLTVVSCDAREFTAAESGQWIFSVDWAEKHVGTQQPFVSPNFVDDRILTESGYWVHVKRPADAPKASMFGGGEVIHDFSPTLRDQFAIAGFQAALSGASGLGEMSDEGREAMWKQVSKIVYEGADEMVAERERAKTA